MKNILRTASVCLFASLALSLGACVAPSDSNTTTTNAPANTATTTGASPAPSASPANQANAKDMPVTLPVLDAMFADEGFAGQLKQNVQLNDEQITRLRQIAREETSKLRETDSDVETRSTAQASQRAAEQIRGVVGEDKFDSFANFVRTRWASGGEEGGGDASGNNAPSGGATSNRPNSVPTDTRIVVNAPAYRMDVFRDGQLVKSYRVGIGYPEFPLPTGLRRANTIIFNPTWTPPDEPWVESSGNVRAGQTVEAGSKLNPLGPVKIPIGSPSLIHGGKSPAKLGSFASHGCVGLTSPQVLDFSRVLAEMSGTQLTPEQIAEYGKNKSETKNVKLSNAVPVELRYETVVVEDGKLHIYRDVYDRDTNTEENLRAVLAAYDVNYDQLSDAEKTKIREALSQMSRDASGRADTQSTQNSNANQNSNSAQGNRNSNNANSNNSNNSRVTRAVKGKKEIVIELAALKGKGYPAAANLDTGSGTAGRTSANAPANNRRR